MTNSKLLKGGATLVAVVALGAAGVAVSSAFDKSSSNNGTAQSNANGQGFQGRGPMAGNVTGSAAAKAKAAALAKYPGTVEHVTRAPNGGYMVHVIQKDGSEVHVLVSTSFKVTGVATGGPPGMSGGGGMPGGAPPNGQPPSGSVTPGAPSSDS